MLKLDPHWDNEHQLWWLSQNAPDDLDFKAFAQALSVQLQWTLLEVEQGADWQRALLGLGQSRYLLQYQQLAQVLWLEPLNQAAAAYAATLHKLTFILPDQQL